MSKNDIPESHPRAESLKYRKAIEDGVESGLVAKAGPIAHGRGEAFDYLIGETTLACVLEDIETAAAFLLEAEAPVISVNGNAAVLAPEALVSLAKAIPAKLEVNVFYGRTEDREKMIADLLLQHGAEHVYGVDAQAKVPNLFSARQHVDAQGMAKADLVLVLLEDGDRTKALIEWGKKVISVDLNPLSRTGRDATLNICDNIVRCLPLLEQAVHALRDKPEKRLQVIANSSNKISCARVMHAIIERLQVLQSP